jgi:hypothetical protein
MVLLLQNNNFDFGFSLILIMVYIVNLLHIFPTKSYQISVVLFKKTNRHLLEIALALLKFANLPKSFWYQSVAHASDLINRMPCKTLTFKSPYELLFQEQPDLTNLKIFGSVCFPHLKPYASGLQIS